MWIDGLGAVAFSGGTFGEGNGSIVFDDVECRGSELQLASCRLSTTPNCLHFEDAGVRCQGKATLLYVHACMSAM